MLTDLDALHLPSRVRRVDDECDNRPMVSSPLLIDTHCHLDAAEFDRDRDAVRAAAETNGVGAIVIPAIAVSNFDAVAQLAHGTAGGHYALGIHPLMSPGARDDDVDALRDAVEVALDDPRFVAIGEIGLDLFVPELTTPDAIAHQTWLFEAQLKIARDFNLPVLLHVRRAQDPVLAAWRRVHGGRNGNSASLGATGIAHAFNGSRQQADHYLDLGFKLGFGGASTFERALRIRALVAQLPEDAFVMETDAPDIGPEWLRDDQGKIGRNAPGELRRIAETVAGLRGVSIDRWAEVTTKNACDVLPRLAAAVTDTPTSTP